MFEVQSVLFEGSLSVSLCECGIPCLSLGNESSIISRSARPKNNSPEINVWKMPIAHPKPEKKSFLEAFKTSGSTISSSVFILSGYVWEI